MIFELLSKDEVIEKISYMYQFSDRNTNENIQNAILNNYDKNYISNIEYTHNEFCNKFKEVEDLSIGEVENNPKYQNIKDYLDKCTIRMSNEVLNWGSIHLTV